jgi:hypothetical protein
MVHAKYKGDIKIMLRLKENEVCPYGSYCPYNKTNSCLGARPNRQYKFTCNYVINGQIVEGQPIRLNQDKTGQMKVIME